MKKLNKNEIIKKVPFKKFILFGLVGGLNTVVDLSVFYLFTSVIRVNYMISQVLGYSAGIINSYFFNRKITFKLDKKAEIKEFIKFFTSNLFCLGLSTIIMFILVDYLQMRVFVSKIITTGSIMIINFIISNYFIFNKK